MEPAIAIGPDSQLENYSGRANLPELMAFRDRIADAVRRGQGRVTAVAEADGLVWLIPGAASALDRILDENPAITWVQFPWAGVEAFAADGVFRRPISFTCAKGSFATQVAEHALMLTLASLRHVVLKVRTPAWRPINPRSLYGMSVTILGGGGIAAELIRLLQPFGCTIRVLRRGPGDVAGAHETLRVADMHAVLPGTDVLVVALALTPETRHIVDGAVLSALPGHAVVVNVARGGHIDTDALVTALKSDSIAAAGLDVTEPEPLPDDHPLWSDSRVLITSHSADSSDYVMEMLCERVTANVQNLRHSRPLEGLVDPALGY